MGCVFLVLFVRALEGVGEGVVCSSVHSWAKSSSLASHSRPCSSISATISPVTHIRIFALDLVADFVIDNTCEADRLVVLELASRLWTQATAVELIQAILEVLPRSEGLRLISFISCNFPTLQTAVESCLRVQLIDLCHSA